MKKTQLLLSLADKLSKKAYSQPVDPVQEYQNKILQAAQSIFNLDWVIQYANGIVTNLGSLQNNLDIKQLKETKKELDVIKLELDKRYIQVVQDYNTLNSVKI